MAAQGGIKMIKKFKYIVLYTFIVVMLCGCGFNDWYDRTFDELFRKWVFNP